MDTTVYTALVPALQSDTCHEVDCAKFSVCWICQFINMAVVCVSCRRVMWISIHLYFYASTSIHPPPQLKWRNSPHDVMPFFRLNHSLLPPTHYTGHHPVILHRDVPPQECCTSGIPSAMPKDRFPASTFDSHLQSASFGDHITN